MLQLAGERLLGNSVTPTLDLAGFRHELAQFDFVEGCAADRLLTWVVAQLEQGAVQTTHRRYFGLFNPAPSFPAQCADRIAAVFNPQLATETTSPVPVAIETHVIRAIATRAGLPAGTIGHFTGGGSEANYTALICALTWAEPEFATKGARAFFGAPVVYVSRDAHSAWFKIVHQAGIGRDALSLIATDGGGRMDVQRLARAICVDREAGRVPVMLAATAGTTNAGMIDPLLECGAVAATEGIWYHVDAAWGGGLIASSRLAPGLKGIETADSLIIDAHKWFATTMGCGMFLTRHAQLLSTAFQATADYMPSQAPSVDPYLTSMQWSRRFLGLRLFLSLAAAGWPGYARHVERAVALATQLAEKLKACGWSIANRSPVAVVCAEPPPGSAGVRSIVDRVVGSGAAWVSLAQFENRSVVRACVTNGETGEVDVAALVALLDEAARVHS
jgi:glutamate/tyrosine decarboxylase-like PLP-dependent enzyme